MKKQDLEAQVATLQANLNTLRDQHIREREVFERRITRGTEMLADANRMLAKALSDRDEALKWQGFWKQKAQRLDRGIDQPHHVSTTSRVGAERRSQMLAAKDAARRTGSMQRVN